MRALLGAATLAAVLACAPVWAAGIVELDLEAPSPILGHPITYSIYRPFPAPAEGERWPVVYLLHGLTGRGADWFSWGDLGPIFDRALAEGRIPPMIIVAPDAGDSWYVDNPDPGGFGLVDSAIAGDLIAEIDHTYPTAACRSGRAVGGVSMGGAGALLQAINHPETYVAAISLSGALHRPLQRSDPRRWIPDLYANVFGTPFDKARFNAANVFTRAEDLRGLAQQPDIYLTIGDRDFPDLIEANAAMHTLLLTTGTDTSLRITAGRHYWDTWQQTIIPALEWLAPRLDPTCR